MMETKGKDKNYYEKLKQEFEQKPLQPNREELINLIREIVRDEFKNSVSYANWAGNFSRSKKHLII